MDKRRWRARARRQQGTTTDPGPRKEATAHASNDGIDPRLFRTDPDQRMALSEQTRETVRRLTRRSARAGMLSPLEYNLTISHERKFIWFRVAKVATRTIFSHLAIHDVPLDVVHAMRTRYPTASFEDYYKFAFVRDPLDRFVSAWRNKVLNRNYFGFDEDTYARMQRIEHFADWATQRDLADLAVTDHHLALQSRLIDLSNLDFLGRLEHFDRDFSTVCQHIGAPVSAPEARNQSRPDAREDERPSAELRSRVSEMYRLDYQIFGY